VRIEDLNTIVQIGNALWLNLDHSRKNTLEVMSAIALKKGVHPEYLIEKTSTALLNQAKNQDATLHSSMTPELFNKVINQEFYRLSIEERFVLIALHSGHWSYARLRRILELNEEIIQELAWGARIKVASQSSYPAGPTSFQSNCPEYDPKKPWTQRFLDDELNSKRDFLFLQVHLASCPSCAQLLARCREVYFNAEAEVRQISQDPYWAKSIEKTLDEMTHSQTHLRPQFFRALKVWSQKWDVRILIAIIGLYFILKLFVFR
jgi:hypothetical protein